MKKLTHSAFALSFAVLGAAPAVQAGGLDLSGQPIDLIFAQGSEARLTFGLPTPNISGTYDVPGFGDTGSVSDRFLAAALGVKMDLSDTLSFSVELDRPYFGDVDYREWAAGPFQGTLDSRQVTALLRYKLNDRFSVYGGPRFTRLNGRLNALGAVSELGNSDKVGFVAGVAFEIPEYFVLASLTYSSAQNHELPTEGLFLPPGATVPVSVAGTTTGIYIPEQIRLDLRAPVNEKTILRGSIRWANWSETLIWPGQALDGGPNTVAEFSDTVVYDFSATRLLSETYAITGSISHEPDNDNAPSFLNVAGGSTTLGAAVTRFDETFTTTLGVTYTMLDDKSGTSAGAPLSYSDNAVIGFGGQISMKF